MAEPGLLVKFSGEDLDVRGVPIYELGDTFISLQRIVHKAYLFERGRLTAGTPMRRSERQQLSLQIVDRERSSDLYVLAPFLADPGVRELIAGALQVGMKSLLDYGLKRVLGDGRHADQSPSVAAENVDGSFLAGAIYADTVNITNHINNIGGIDTVEFRPTGPVHARPVTFDETTQTYVRELANEVVYGPEQDVIGYVTRLHPNRLMAEIKVAPSHYVRVHMSEDMFKYVRYATEAEELLLFRGRPVLRLGKDNLKVTEIEATWVQAAP